MIVAGNAFKILADPYHVYVILTPPDGDEQAIVINLSSMKDHTEDTSCILNKDDYPEYIDRPTAIWYAKAKLWPVAPFSDTKYFKRMPDIPPKTLEKLQTGAIKSSYVRERYKQIVRTAIAPDRS